MAKSGITEEVQRELGRENRHRRATLAFLTGMDTVAFVVENITGHPVPSIVFGVVGFVLFVGTVLTFG